MGNVYSSLGAIYYARGNFHEAINNYQESMEMRIRQGNLLRVAQTENNIANSWYNIARYDMAIEYYQKALPVFERFKYSPGIASIYNGMAVIYFDQKLYDKSLENHLKKLEISRETGNLKEVGNTLNNIGNVYEKITYDSLSNILGSEFEDIIIRDKTDKYLKMYSRALNYYNQSLQIRKDLNDRPGLLVTLGNIGILYMHAGKLDTALEYLEMTRTFSQEMNNIDELARALMRIGQICAYKFKYDAALQYLNQSLDYAIQMDIKALIQDIYGILSGIYEKKNDYYQALAYYKLYSAVKDSISQKETLNMMTEMQVKFETENIVKANELLMVKSQLSETRVKQQKILIYFFIIILFLISVLVFFLIRRNYMKRQKTHLDIQGKLFSGLWFKKISLKLLRLFQWLI
jgi:tetratricopeptide (TPR) repeat protein